MGQKKEISFIKRSLFFSLAVLVGVLGKLGYELGAAPSEEKACDFITPKAVDQTKPTSIEVEPPRHILNIQQKGGVINDASCLNKTSIYAVVEVTSEEDLINAVAFANENDLKVTAAGERHSMGGQSFVKDGLVLNMKGFNQMEVNEEAKTLTVQSGASWEQVQRFLDPKGLSLKAMQSINIFTIGGTISVNAHGIAHDPGPVASTIKSMRILKANGEIVTASPTENTELFSHVIGGYGLFGLIVDVQLELVDNELYEWDTHYTSYDKFVDYYEEHINDNPDIGLTYSRLAISPQDYLKQVAIHTYSKTDVDEAIPALKPTEQDTLNRLVINFSKTGPFGRWLRWTLEKNFAPLIAPCISRNQALSSDDACIVARNQQMYDAMGYLKNRLEDTDILHEYFIPKAKMREFVDGLRETVQRNDANLLNVTIRTVHKDEISALPYAKEDMFAFVLYFNQKLNQEDSDVLKQTTVELIDLATSLEGTYYLPYQLYYAPEQLRAAYPEIEKAFEYKRQIDPNGRFTNTFYEKYGTSSS